MGLEKAIGKAIISYFAPQGLPYNEIIGIARRSGGGYRRQDMLSDIRAITGRVKMQTQVENLAVGVSVPKHLMVNTDLGFPYKYRVYGESTYFDEELETEVIKTSSFYTDDLDTIETWEGDFVGFYEGQYSENNQTLRQFKVKGVEHNRGYSY